MVAMIYFLVMLIQWRWSGPYWKKISIHVHATNIVREVAMVFGFSWIARVMFDSLGKVLGIYFQGGYCWVVTIHTNEFTFVVGSSSVWPSMCLENSSVFCV
jgi:hypothetical protein